MKNFSILATLGLSVALLSSAIGSSAYAVTLVHSNDVLGEIEPCGCRTNPLGGMARKQNYLKKITAPNIIQVDGGDLLFQSDEIPEALRKQTLLQAQYLLKVLEMTGMDAVVPGEKEFAMGFRTFQDLAKKTQIHFLAANLATKSGKKPFESSLIVKRKEDNGKTVSVGLFGIVDPKLNWPKELKGQPSIAAAREQVKALKGKVDYIVALTHEGEALDEVLAKAVPGIDIIIGGHSQSFLQVPVTVGSTHIYQSSFRNQYIGALPLTKPLKDEDYKLTGMDAAYDSPADAQTSVDKIVAEFKTAIADLNSREETEMQQAVWKSSPTDPHSLKFHTFPRCAECHLKQFDFWRKTKHAKAFATLFEAKQNQNKDCLQCHTVGMGDPGGFSFVTRIAELRNSSHDSSQAGNDASADADATTQPSKSATLSPEDLNAFLNSLRDAKSLDSKVKMSAHGDEEVPLRQSLNMLGRSYTPVQCENCHQPGMDHPFSPGYTKTVARDTCLKCHTQERAPEWYNGKEPNWALIDKKRASITCPAGDLPPEE